jgi:DNA-binding CsgD family transcriptional regulator/type II secretory pathway predicted ATPase ExeA
MPNVTQARSPIVVGRKQELDALREAIDQLASGRGTSLVLVGEAGSGKTRLLREAASEAARRHLPTLAGGASPGMASPAFGVLASTLRPFLRRWTPPEDELRPFGPGLKVVLPEWPVPDGGTAFSSDQLHLLALEGAFRLLDAAAGEQGIVVTLDDLHASDPETLAFVHHASTSIRDVPIALISAIRVHEDRRALEMAETLERSGAASVIEVGALDASGVEDLLEQLLGSDPPADLVETVVARTHGIPLLVEELVDAFVAAGTLGRDGGGVAWDVRAAVPVPKTTVGFVAARLKRLSTASRSIAHATALAGRSDPALLSSLTGLSENEVSQALRDCVDAGLLEADGDRVWFRHPLIAEATLEDLLPPERKLMHARAAEALAGLPDQQPDLLAERAFHLEQMGERDAAARLLVTSATTDMARHTLATAEEALIRASALAVSERTADAAAAALAEVLGLQGRLDEALRLDESFLDRVGSSAERLARMARHAVSAGRLDAGDDLLRRAEEAGAEPAPLRALSALALLWRGNLDEAEAAAAEALELADASGDHATACAALDVIARSADAAGRRTDAAEAFGRWERRAREAGLAASRLQALMELGNLDWMSGGPSERLEEARRLSVATGAFTSLVLADLSLVWWKGHRGEFDEAERLGEEAVDLCRRFGLDLLPHALVAAGWARDLRRIGDGEPAVAEALSLSSGDHDLEIMAAWSRGDREVRLGRFTEAAETYRPAVELILSQPSAVPPPAPFMCAVALAASGAVDEAHALLERFRETPAISRLYLNPIWAAVAQALADGNDAALESAATAWSIGGEFNQAITLAIGAASLDGAPVERWLPQALEIFERVGAGSDAERIRGLMRRAGIAVPRRKRTAPDMPKRLRDAGVTAREADVLSLIVEGLTNREIAERLYLSVRTVESHISSLLMKTGAGSRAALIALGLEARDARAG